MGALFTLIVFLYGFANHKNNDRKITHVFVSFEKGNNLFMNFEMVNKLLIQNGATVKNKEKSVIDLHKLELSVLSHPMVESAAVFLTVEGSLKASVKQRTPIARVINNNLSYYIDKQAEKMPLSVNYSERVMIVSGNVNERDFVDIHHLVTTILNDVFLKKQIIGIEKMPNNEYNLETRMGGQTINLGKVENLKEKFKNLSSFYNKTMSDGTLAMYSSINLKYNKQVVCTKDADYGTR